jgi:hypothetical protein
MSDRFCARKGKQAFGLAHWRCLLAFADNQQLILLHSCLQQREIDRITICEKTDPKRQETLKSAEEYHHSCLYPRLP